MSYILEALRRSQAERDRNRVPGLDDQPAPVDAGASRRRSVPIVWVASGLGLLILVLVVAAATWWMRPQPRPRPVAVPAPAPVARPAPPLPQVVSVPPAPATPAPVAPVPRAPRPAANAASPAAPGAAPPTAAPLPPPTAAAPSPPPPTAQPAPAAPRTLTLAELGADQRRELPALAIGGSVWSDNAASRFVIVNGLLVREGEAAAPGVTVERIGPKSVVVRWRELRIELPL